MRRVLRFVVWGTIATVLLGLVVTYSLYRAAHAVPEFYSAALEADPQQQAAAGDQLEHRVLDLHNSLHDEGRWEALFTDEEINGWLATVLPEKFANLLPKGLADPRVVISPAQAQVACRYEHQRITTVVSLSLRISVTDEPNVVAVQVGKARAGLVPLPLQDFLDDAAKVARRGKLDLRWSQVEGEPVALIRIPTQHDDYRFREVHIDTIELREGAIYFAGQTGETATAQNAPTPQAGEKNRTTQRDSL